MSANRAPDLDDPDNLDEAARWLSMDSALSYHQALVFLLIHRGASHDYISDRYSLTPEQVRNSRVAAEAKITEAKRLIDRLTYIDEKL